MISWQSREQFNIAPSTIEVKYIVACSTNCEVVWLRMLLTNLFDLEMESTMILCDNRSCIKMMENLAFHAELKHIEILCLFISDMLQRGAIKLQYVEIDE